MTNEIQEQTIEGTAREIERVQLGTIQASSPQDIVVRATAMAKTLSNIITEQGLFTTISGRKYVHVEGWTTLGAMLGIMPREVEDGITEHENGDYEAVVELIRASDGAVIGRASSIVSTDEKTWANRPRYARRSMAVTRATGKAYRLGFSWIMKLAGYEPTPAEEMPMEGSYREIAKPKRKPAPKREQVEDAITDAGPEAVDEPMTIERAAKIVDSKGTPYIEIDSDTLSRKTIGISKGLNKPDLTEDKHKFYQEKLDAIKVILQSRADGSI
jgi:hypothetical protein